MSIFKSFRNKKYDLSLERIVSRIFITGVVGIVFGIAMVPFMTTADGLLYSQRASIGGQNMIKMIALWGFFTIIATLLMYWKKRFRMVSIFLIICWIVSILFYIFIIVTDSSQLPCKRTLPNPIPNEFSRALDLIAQRLDIESKYGTSYEANAFSYINCLDIQYSENNDNDIEGFFLEEDPTLQNFFIRINPQYKSLDDISIAMVLIHELTHVGQYIYEILTPTKLDCFGKEAEAFTTQSIFASQLNPEEKRSIYARILENSESNPAFQILANVDQRTQESFDACQRLRNENNLTDTQFNECVWAGTKNKLLVDIKQDPYYQQQCSNDK